jgi:hypothetical protein
MQTIAGNHMLQELTLTAAIKMAVSCSVLLGVAEAVLPTDAFLSELVKGGIATILAYCLWVVWKAREEDRRQHQEQLAKRDAAHQEQLAKRDAALERMSERFIDHLKTHSGER